MSTCLDTTRRPSRCYRVAPRPDQIDLRSECRDACSVCMTAFVRDFAAAVASSLIARPRESKTDIWLFP